MRNWIILAITALFFGFSLFQASWIAPTPTGGPRLIAGKGVALAGENAGCPTGSNIASLAVAVANEADAVNVATDMANGQLAVGNQFGDTCAAQAGSPTETIGEAVYALSKPQLLWRAKGADQAAQLLAQLPPATGEDKQGLIGDKAAVDAFKKARPKSWAFSIAEARACASDYRTSGLWGGIPESCKQGTMLLTVDELGYTLWGWPNRFLARTGAAGLKIVVAEGVEGDAVKGLTDVTRYSDIASSFNGHIWIDNIEELGPALRR
jgi:glycerophosphoryl diester phosphodiesterase